MTVTTYIQLLNAPGTINSEQVVALEKILDDFPYFQSARSLHLKGLHKQDSFKYNQSLKTTAAYTSDRTILFDLITAKDLVNFQKSIINKGINSVEHHVESTNNQNEIKEEKTSIAVEEVTTPAIIQTNPNTINVNKEEVYNTTTIDSNNNQNSQIDNTKVTIENAIESPIQTTVNTMSSNKENVNKIIFSATNTVDDQSILEERTRIAIEESIQSAIVQQATTNTKNSKNEEIDNTNATPIYSINNSDTSAEITKALVEETIPSNTIQNTVNTVSNENEQVTKAIVTPVDNVNKQNSLEDRTKTSIEESIKSAISHTIPEKNNQEEEINIKAEEISANIETTIKEIKKEKIEEKVAIENPIAFNTNETRSFQEWLQLSRIKPIERTQNEEKTEQKTEEDKNNFIDNQLEIIDKFIESNPKIQPIKAAVSSVIMPFKEEDTSYIMTETLAKVYLEQKKYSKAIQAYEILILKYPEKSSFFANRILEIKSLQENNR